MNPLQSPAPWRRRLVLFVALALGVLLSLAFEAGPLDSAVALAQPAATAAPADGPAHSAPAKVAAVATKPAAAMQAVPPAPDTAATAAAVPAPEAARSSTSPAPGAGATVGVTIDDGHKVHVSGLGNNGDYDSFEEFVDSAPWLAGLVFLSVTLFFLVPLAVIILLIWYKMRKNRMLNETMLKLAERGVVPPAEAMAAIGAEAPPQLATPAATALYEQARAIRERRTWSDLRRGIVMATVGLGLCAYALFDGGEASAAGLILLFLGCGYVVLWYLEDRRSPSAANGPRL